MSERTKRVVVRGLLAVAAVVSALMFAPHGGLVGPSEAHAVIGRPQTPISYAGVARRTVRRW